MIHTKCRPPIINIKSQDLINKNSKFFIDTGADISIVKAKTIQDDVKIDTSLKIHVHGVTAGKQTTIGAITLHINKLPCTFHVINNDINLEVDGLIGCHNLQIHNGKIDMKEKFIKLGNIKLRFPVISPNGIPRTDFPRSEFPEWTFLIISIIPNGHEPELTFPRMQISPNVNFAIWKI